MKSEFHKEDFSKHYVFHKGRIGARSGPPPKMLTNRKTGYQFFRLLDNNGKRRAVSAALALGHIEKVGDLYFVSRFPAGQTRPEFPAYVFNHKTRTVWRVGFKVPRIRAVKVTPNSGGYLVLTDHTGAKQALLFREVFPINSEPTETNE